MFNSSVLSLFSQALRSQWDKDAESAKSNLQTSLSETQNSLTATQSELASTQASLSQTSKALTDAQVALSQTQSELQESHGRLEKLNTSSKEQSLKLEEELKQAWADRDAAACELHHSAVLFCSFLNLQCDWISFIYVTQDHDWHGAQSKHAIITKRWLNYNKSYLNKGRTSFKNHLVYKQLLAYLVITELI